MKNNVSRETFYGNHKKNELASKWSKIARKIKKSL